jgi:ribonuclease HI
MKIIEVYTDGACTQGNFMPWPGGYAALLLVNGEVIKTIKDSKLHTTNNEMELTAFLNGLQMAQFEKNDLSEDFKIKIYTDSAYIQNCFKFKWYERWINNNWTTSTKEPVKNKALWVEIINLYKQLSPEIIKVEAHKNDFYNNYVDKLAVEAKEEMVRQNENNSYIG